MVMPALLDDCASRSSALAKSDCAELLMALEGGGLPAKLARGLSDVIWFM
jgi:hypothetical protein